METNKVPKEGTMISDWLNEHGNPEILKKVEREAILKYGEPKQETLEEAAIRTFDEFKLKNPIVPESAIYPYKLGFAKGTTWQQERMYSEEEVHKIIESYQNIMENNPIHIHYDKWFKQFKKK